MKGAGRFIVVCFLAGFLAGCGGGGDSSETDTGSDPATGGGSVNPTPSPDPGAGPSPDPSPTPDPGSILTNSTGAAPGLPGCLNKGLYLGGANQVNVTYDEIRESDGPLDNNPRVEEVVTETTTIEFLSGDANEALANATYPFVGPRPFVVRWRLTGDTISTIGQVMDDGSVALYPGPPLFRFDLAAGESYSHVHNTAILDQVSIDRTWEHTYIGRETVVLTGGQVFPVCRVESKQVNIEPVKVERIDLYAVGSGILVGSTGFEFDPGEPPAGRTIRRTRFMTSASINGVAITP